MSVRPEYRAYNSQTADSCAPPTSNGGSYLPALILFCKVALYTSIVPAFLYGGELHTTLTGLGLVALYFDRLYFGATPQIDTTAVATDVMGCHLLAFVRAPQYKR